MPYMQRITWSGIALHAVVVPGHPASHGCIRLKEDFAIRLWHLTKRGTRVIIARNDVQPVEVALPHLFKPKAASDLTESRAATVPADSINTASVTHGSFTSNTEMQPATYRLRTRLPPEWHLKGSSDFSLVSRGANFSCVRFQPLFTAVDPGNRVASGT
jgi:hypothetical protein